MSTIRKLADLFISAIINNYEGILNVKDNSGFENSESDTKTDIKIYTLKKIKLKKHLTSDDSVYVLDK